MNIRKCMKTLLMAVVLTGMLAGLCGCGSSSYEAEPVMETAEYDMAAAADGDYGGFAASGMNAKADAAAAEEMESAPAEAPAQADGAQTQTVNPEKIIYSASATLETQDYDKAVASVEQMVKDAGGYVESSSVNAAEYDTVVSGGNTSRSAFYTLRVPQEKLQEMLTSLSALGNVPNTNMYTENVTNQYYDTQARLDSYAAQEKRLIELLDKAETVADVIEIEAELSNVRYEIESLRSTLNYWDHSVTYSTLNLDIREVGRYTPAQGDGFGAQLREALLNGFDGLKDFILIVVELLPVLIILALIVWAVIAVIRKIRRKNGKTDPVKAARKAEKKAKKKEERVVAETGTDVKQAPSDETAEQDVSE